MKRKIIAIILATVMILSLTVMVGAAETTYKVSDLKEGRTINLVGGGSHKAYLIKVKDEITNDHVGWTFCVDLHHSTNVGVGKYFKKDWTSSNINNPGKVAWLLNQARVSKDTGNIDTTYLATISGVAKLSQKDAIAVY